jgi:multidrug transporter EmrE-like cation transporter
MSDCGKSCFLLAAYVVASTTGLLLLKGSVNRIAATGGPMLALSGDAVLLAAGLMLYVLSFCLWVGVLARMPLSTAFPLAIGLTLAFTTTGAALFFGERLGLLKLAGLLLIFAGCAAVSLSDK